MKKQLISLAIVSTILSSFYLYSCGGKTDTTDGGQYNSYKVSGVVSGLTGTGLVIQNNGGDDLHIVTNGSFTFSTALSAGATYSVTVKTHPLTPNQTCTASNNTGTISNSNITNVSVVCSTNTYSVGGVVSGLTGTGLVLKNNNGDNLPIISNGTFTFSTPLADGSSYNVAVNNQPSGQICIVSNATGTLSGVNISDIKVDCPTFTLAKTGQLVSYDTGSIDDGALRKGVVWPSPRFSNPNGSTPISGSTILDNLTGLMWPKDGNTPGPVACSPASNKTWQAALDFVACLNTNAYLGYSDWRLPNRKELKSLLNLNEPNHASWLNSQGFSGVQSGYYWASTTYTYPYSGNVKDWGWYVDMSDGSVGAWPKTNSFAVIPVRAGNGQFNATIYLPKTGQTTCYDSSGTVISCSNSGQDGESLTGVEWPNPRFTNLDGSIPVSGSSIVDKLTGLMWTRDGDATGPAPCSPGSSKNWQSALDYIACLNTNNYLGYIDWRLPNANELETLANNEVVNTSVWLNTQGFTSAPPSQCWSSSTYAGSTDQGWVVDYGVVGHGSKGGLYCVWPVRSAY